MKRKAKDKKGKKTRSIDEILKPVRDAFAKSGITEAELDEAINEARREVYASKHKRDASR